MNDILHLQHSHPEEEREKMRKSLSESFHINFHIHTVIISESFHINSTSILLRKAKSINTIIVWIKFKMRSFWQKYLHEITGIRFVDILVLSPWIFSPQISNIVVGQFTIINHINDLQVERGGFQMSSWQRDGWSKSRTRKVILYLFSL